MKNKQKSSKTPGQKRQIRNSFLKKFAICFSILFIFFIVLFPLFTKSKTSLSEVEKDTSTKINSVDVLQPYLVEGCSDLEFKNIINEIILFMKDKKIPFKEDANGFIRAKYENDLLGISIYGDLKAKDNESFIKIIVKSESFSDFGFDGLSGSDTYNADKISDFLLQDEVDNAKIRYYAALMFTKKELTNL
ncbi:MAG: hypothetical protein WA101_00185 [Minisyncoccia bacterium]